MNIEVKNSVKPVDYNKSIEILERRVEDILLGKKNELLWILSDYGVQGYLVGITETFQNDILLNLTPINHNYYFKEF